MLPVKTKTEILKKTLENVKKISKNHYLDIYFFKSICYNVSVTLCPVTTMEV